MPRRGAEDSRLFPRAPGLLDLEESAQPPVERGGSTGNQRGLKDFNQFLLGGAGGACWRV
jgi:hypothetical protein